MFDEILVSPDGKTFRYAMKPDSYRGTFQITHNDILNLAAGDRQPDGSWLYRLTDEAIDALSSDKAYQKIMDGVRKREALRLRESTLRHPYSGENSFRQYQEVAA